MTDDEIRLKIAELRGVRKTWDWLVWWPNWPVKISDAFELLEEMAEEHFTVKLMRWDHSKEWYVIMHHRQGHDENIPDDEIVSDTAPRAICLAYIAWKEAQRWFA